MKRWQFYLRILCGELAVNVDLSIVPALLPREHLLPRNFDIVDSLVQVLASETVQCNLIHSVNLRPSGCRQSQDVPKGSSTQKRVASGLVFDFTITSPTQFVLHGKYYTPISFNWVFFTR